MMDTATDTDTAADTLPLLTSTFSPADVTVLLRPGTVELVGVAEKEALLRAGRGYGTLLTPEAAPSAVQLRAYREVLARNGARLGSLLAGLSATLLRLHDHHPEVVYLSLARAGTPVGAVLRRLARAAGRDVPHYALSIIRGEGLDASALRLVRARHPRAHLVFVDGWSGKGAIANTLRASLAGEVVSWSLAMPSDPAGVADHAATFGDVLWPHAALNATVSGLLSRSFLTEPGQLHGARLETDLAPFDVSRAFVDELERLARAAEPAPKPTDRPSGAPEIVVKLARTLGATDPNLVKPGVGEATRVFLRRAPGRLLVREEHHPDTAHLRVLADERGVPTSVHPDLPYLAAALIRSGRDT